MGIFDKLFGNKSNTSKSASNGDNTPSTDLNSKPLEVAEDKINDIIIQRKLRPLGNKKRLCFGEGGDCNDYRAQFRDRESAERYYDAFVKYAGINPPPVLMEVMVAYTPNTIYSEKYSFILPYFNIGVREDYQEWAREAILDCNDVQMQHSYSAGNYQQLPNSISSKGSVIKWTIIPTDGFDLDSSEAQELLSDPPEMGFKTVNIEGESGTVPEKSDPQGPWIGVLFNISKFDEAWYGKAATNLLVDIVGGQNLSNCVIHGGDLLPDAKYWCNAIHTNSHDQADIIAESVMNSKNEKLASEKTPVIPEKILPINTLPFQGFVTNEGEYIGN